MNVESCWGRVVSTHLIGIMFQGTVVTHVSHSVQVCISLVNIVNIGAVVLLIQYAWRMIVNKQCEYIYTYTSMTLWHKVAQILFFPGPHHLHQCPQHKHLPLHCCPCPFGLGYYCRGSCHSGHPRHHGHSQTAWGCKRTDSCPVSKIMREEKNKVFRCSNVICHLRPNGRICREGVMWYEKVLYF